MTFFSKNSKRIKVEGNINRNEMSNGALKFLKGFEKVEEMTTEKKMNVGI